MFLSFFSYLCSTVTQFCKNSKLLIFYYKCDIFIVIVVQRKHSTAEECCMNIKQYLPLLVLIHGAMHLNANDTSSLILQNSSSRFIQVLIQQNLAQTITTPPEFPWLSGPQKHGCIYKADLKRNGLPFVLEHVCKYPGLAPQSTTTYSLNVWPTINPDSMRFSVYIIDTNDNVLGVRHNVRGGTKIEFPRNFDQP
jgi:hypothetical protein